MDFSDNIFPFKSSKNEINPNIRKLIGENLSQDMIIIPKPIEPLEVFKKF